MKINQFVYCPGDACQLLFGHPAGLARTVPGGRQQGSRVRVTALHVVVAIDPLMATLQTDSPPLEVRAGRLGRSAPILDAANNGAPGSPECSANVCSPVGNLTQRRSRSTPILVWAAKKYFDGRSPGSGGPRCQTNA
jgi:hypothetical protein